MRHFKTALCSISLGIAAISVPALAQDDIVVSGPFVQLPDGRMLSSQTVNYSDLDLTFAGDRAELRRRVSDTAREVCGRLRRYSEYPVVHSQCETGAYSGAIMQVRRAEGDWAVAR